GNKFNFVLAEDMGEHTTSRAIHGIDSKFESGLRDQLQISEAADGTDVGRFQICFFAVRPLPVWHAASSGFLFDQFRDGGGRGTAEFGFELYPIPVPGIVTGSDNDATRRPGVLDGERDRRSRDVVVR